MTRDHQRKMRFHTIKKREMKFHQCEKKKKMFVKLKSVKFIVSRGIQDSSKREFIKKGKDSPSIKMCKRIEARKMYRECIKMT